MAQTQTWDNCDYFGSRSLCPHMKESELMKEFAPDAIIPQLSVSADISGIEERGMEIDKLFCRDCSEFIPMD